MLSDRQENIGMRVALALALCLAIACCTTSNKPPPNTALVVFFPPNSALLLPKAARIINRIAADANRQGAIVEVSGPAAKPKSRRKPSLEEQRTIAVEHALVAAGVEEKRVHRVNAAATSKKTGDPAGMPVEIHLIVPKPVA
jgi:OmpA family/Beta-ketoacyl synthase, C-terminal domain